MSRLTEWLSAMKGKDGKKLTLIFWLGICGMVLILLSDVFPAEPKEKTMGAEPTRQLETYTRQLEQDLQEILTQVAGAGETRVMLTLDSSAETVYASDTHRVGDREETETQHILLDTQQGESALVEMVWQPEIRGVAVVCEGGDDIRVTSQITQIVSVLLGVSTNRISVAKMS